uniref:Uncharacterized protein n=1 Tax=Vitis vinifera TaxID=29760 RepID=F6I5A7_VITVI
MAKDLFVLQASSGNQDFCSDDLTLWNQIIALVVLSFSMGIQKIGRHVSGVSSDCRRVSYSSNVDNMVLEENQASGTSFEDDSDDCEFEEVRCELGVVEAYMHIDEVGLQKSSAKVDFIQVPCEERNTRTKTKRWINEDQNDKKRAFYCLLLY